MDTIEMPALVGLEIHDVLREAAGRAPVLVESATGAYVVVRYADVETLAHDSARVHGIGLAFFDLMGITSGPLRDWYGGLMFTNEGDEHRRLRSLVSRAFTPRSVDLLRADTAERSAEVVDRVLADGGGDLVALTARVPMHVMCRLLGVPVADVEVFGDWADALSPIFGIMTPEQVDAATVAIGALLGYVADLAAARADDPGDDLITALLRASDGEARLTRDEVVAMVANLIVGGHDTTASQLACSLFTLLAQPQEAKRLRAGDVSVASAVTETIRFEPAIAAVPRTAAEPLHVAGVDIAPASVVILMTAAANREPGVWDDPDRLDVGRFDDPRAPRLLSFGAGPHFCLGANLARMTIEEVVGAVFGGRATLAPTVEPRELPWRVVLGRAPTSLPVAVG